MKPCPDRQDEIVAQALKDPWLVGAPDLRAHVDECPGCRAYITEMAETLSRLEDGVPPITPSQDVKGRVLARIRSGSNVVPHVGRTGELHTVRLPRTFRWLVAAVVVLLLFNGILMAGLWRMQSQLSALTRLLEVGGSQMAVAYDLMGLLGIPSDATLDLLGTDSASQAAGRASVYHTQVGHLVVVSVWGLPVLEDRRHVYQVWLKDAGGSQNGGVFRVDPLGRGTLIYRAGGDFDFEAIGVTQEPDPYGHEPRGRQVLFAKLP